VANESSCSACNNRWRSLWGGNCCAHLLFQNNTRFLCCIWTFVRNPCSRLHILRKSSSQTFVVAQTCPLPPRKHLRAPWKVTKIVHKIVEFLTAQQALQRELLGSLRKDPYLRSACSDRAIDYKRRLLAAWDQLSVQLAVIPTLNSLAEESIFSFSRFLLCRAGTRRLLLRPSETIRRMAHNLLFTELAVTYTRVV
jgi:hypothetical protein